MADQFIHIFAKTREAPDRWTLLFADLSTSEVKPLFLTQYRSNGKLLTSDRKIILISELREVRIFSTKRTLTSEVEAYRKHREWEIDASNRYSNVVIISPNAVEPSDIVELDWVEKEDLTATYIKSVPGNENFFVKLKGFLGRAFESALAKLLLLLVLTMLSYFGFRAAG